MVSQYSTLAGDALDLICQRHYGRQAGAVEIVLDANPHIADLAHNLPAGTLIMLPDLKSEEGGAMLRLWD